MGDESASALKDEHPVLGSLFFEIIFSRTLDLPLLPGFGFALETSLFGGDEAIEEGPDLIALSLGLDEDRDEILEELKRLSPLDGEMV